ncbi:MAG: SDR family oxidoreductase [Desulfuromonadales bacterium]|nr:SDR family oxidoreductase [Desulfuromonadales bacterium]
MRPGYVPLNSASKICLFGVGVSLSDCYQQLIQSLGRKPDYLCDNSPGKWGRQFWGVSCISPEELGRLGERIAVIITVRRYEDIHLQLSALGLKEIFVACFDRAYDIVGGIHRLGDEQLAVSHESFVNPVRGRWTLITGAARGIGRQIALGMAGLGSNIIAHSRQIAHTRELADSCAGLGVEVLPIAAELGDPQEVEALLDDLEANFPPIDLLFNNAAISLPCGADPWNIASADFQAHFSINTIAPIRICYRLIPAMMRRGFGRVINISSTIQKRPGEMAYACSKAALNKFVHDLAPSLEGTGVMMSLVCPGYVRTDMGGPNAPYSVESVIPGALLGAVLDGDINGRWFIAQDYAGLDLPTAMKKAKFYYAQDQEV